MKILFISLGCDKNLADSEEMLGLLTAGGHEITDDETCLLYTSPSPRDPKTSRMPSSA